MRKNLLRTSWVIALCWLSTLSLLAQIPVGYYSSLKGKRGADLKEAVYEIIKDAKVLSYGSGSGATWSGFWDTDRTADGYFIDRYSAKSAWVKSTNKGAKGSGMNIEHSFPKSWWGGTENQAYKDLYNLMPCESKINSTKGNYPMGTVTGSASGNGWTKVGKGSDGNIYWEPNDMWKGDFARGYMYMATTYQNFTWTNDRGKQILETNTYPTLQKWAYTLFIDWAKNDEPDEVEITRNNAVYKIQGNRNPFVDFPELMDYVWGDKVNEPFDPSTAKCTTTYDNGSDTPGESTNETIYAGYYTTDEGGCTERTVTLPAGLSKVWEQNSTYGWKGTAYNSGTKNVADSYLDLPEIDLTNYQSATLNFDHAVNFIGTDLQPDDQLSVEVTCDGKTYYVGDITWATGNSWDFVNSGNADLSAYCGKKITISFHYTSSTTSASTWEIKKLVVKGTRQTTAIDTIDTDDSLPYIDLSKPYQLYTIDGRRISGKDAHGAGFVIVKQHNKVAKMVVK